MAEVAAVVPAAGSGSRMGKLTKKQFLSLGGIPVLGHTLKILDDSRVIDRIVIVSGIGEEDYCRSAVAGKLGIGKVSAIVAGGRERQDSVYNGLLALSPDTGIVVIHDGVRPLLSADSLEVVVEAARTYGAATLAVPVKDTVKKEGGGGFVSGTLSRENLWLAQTPQAFQYSLIISAHRRAREENCLATDDAGLVELMGYQVKIVQGSYLNIKITTPEDLLLAESIIRAGRD